MQSSGTGYVFAEQTKFKFGFLELSWRDAFADTEADTTGNVFAEEQCLKDKAKRCFGSHCMSI